MSRDLLSGPRVALVSRRCYVMGLWASAARVSWDGERCGDDGRRGQKLGRQAGFIVCSEWVTVWSQRVRTSHALTPHVPGQIRLFAAIDARAQAKAGEASRREVGIRNPRRGRWRAREGRPRLPGQATRRGIECIQIGIDWIRSTSLTSIAAVFLSILPYHPIHLAPHTSHPHTMISHIAAALPSRVALRAAAPASMARRSAMAAPAIRLYSTPTQSEEAAKADAYHKHHDKEQMQKDTVHAHTHERRPDKITASPNVSASVRGRGHYVCP